MAPRWTIRTRLALLYTCLFLAAGLILLGVTMAVMREALYVQQTSSVVVNAPEFINPTDPATEQKNQLYQQALRDDFRQQILTSMARSASITLAVLVLAGFGLGWLLARQSLRPVQHITATARRVAEGNLRERIALEGPRDELRELADTFDAMLSRLDAAFDSQRQFVANASHELRTPLAINRTLIEVAMARPDAPPEVTSLGTSLLQVNERQQATIDGLLALATSERRLIKLAPVDLADIVQSAVRSLESEATQHEVTVTVTTATAPMLGEPVLLELLTMNLVQNAIRHNLAGGEAWVSCTSDEDGTQIRVVNTGPLVDADRVCGIFEPFRRHAVRVNSRQGHGLGLSIVRAVVRAHGGAVSATSRDEGGLIVVATLPRFGLPAEDQQNP